MSEIAILMTVHNRREKTLQCLEQVYRQIGAMRRDVYLTDDGCTDGTVEAIRLRYPEVRIVPGDGQLFWCRGMVRAWEAALASGKRYDAFLWLNDDSYLYDRALLTLEQLPVEAEAIRVGAVCSAVSGDWTYGGRLGEAPAGIADAPIRVDTFNGNVVWIPRLCYERIGILDAHYSHALGDFDYGMTATEAGIPIYQTPTFIGTCEIHERLPLWRDPAQPLARRWKALRSPLGCPPEEYFYFDRKHRGILTGAFHWCSIQLRALFPACWHS